jgi:hypothetical protein
MAFHCGSSRSQNAKMSVTSRSDACEVLLQHVVLHGARELRPGDAMTFGNGDIQGQQDDGGRVDRHRRRDAIERNAVEERGHVVERVDGHADTTDLAVGERMVGVVAHLRR